jgi:DNA invertase Pin-like site-specific DNA recombinase
MEVKVLVGYARVSTGSQSLEAQLEALKAAGCQKIFAEKKSGADGERKELARLLKAIYPEDTVVVCRLDRLAKSTRDLLNVLDQLGKANVGFKSRARQQSIPRALRAAWWCPFLPRLVSSNAS